ncbi:MAG: Rrf2 family transcriptional regulator [Gemmatimonadaceae bacterium]
MTMMPRTAEYAVRAAVLLARHYGERRVSADEIATVLGAPRNYLSKTLNALVRSGVLTSMRGPTGGFSLAKTPELISVADVIDVFADAEPAAARCVLEDRPCDSLFPCAAHRRWVTITRIAREPLVATTIGELCGNHRWTNAHIIGPSL